MKNVNDIAASGLCIGCAACFPVCGKGCIEYQENGGMGFPVPRVMQCEGCGTCLRACPVSGFGDDEGD